MLLTPYICYPMGKYIPHNPNIRYSPCGCFFFGSCTVKHKNEVKVHNRFLHLHNGCHIVSRLTIE